MARGRYYLGRVVKINLDQPKLINAIKNAPIVTIGKFDWTLTDIEDEENNGFHYIFGRMSKYAKDGQANLKQAFESKELNQDAVKWLALVPLGIAGWTLNEARSVIFPDEKSVKILSKWLDYWKLKAHFHVGITFCTLLIVPCLFIWFFDELKNFQSAWSFCTFTLALAINAGSFYFAKIEIKSILARE